MVHQIISKASNNSYFKSIFFNVYDKITKTKCGLKLVRIVNTRNNCCASRKHSITIGGTDY